VTGTVIRDGVARSTHEYAAPAGKPLLLDLHRPVDSRTPLVTLYLHGGGWAGGERGDYAEHRAHALARRGIAVASIDYRLVPEARFPAPLDDARAAMRWLREHGDRLGLSTRRVGAWGASAGGHLAAMLGLLTEPAAERADAVVTWAAPLDLVELVSRSALESALLPPSRESGLLGNPAVGPDDPLVWSASPRRLAHAEAAPFLLVHGDRDRLIPAEQSRSMHRELSAHGVSSTLLCLGQAGHEDEAFHQPLVLDLVERFLTAALSESGPTRAV
jgi:acetyl esterase/lipase